MPERPRTSLRMRLDVGYYILDGVKVEVRELITKRVKVYTNKCRDFYIPALFGAVERFSLV
jgi:hypothetical protein